VSRLLLILICSIAFAANAVEELILNGDFERGKEPWSGEITDEEAHSGRRSIKLDNSRGKNWAAVAYNRIVPLRAGVPYRMSIYVKRETGDGYLRIGGYPVNAKGERLRTGRSWFMVFFPIEIMTGEALGRWTRFETIFTVHRPDFAGLIVRFVHRHGKDVIYFDDFSIVEANLPPAPEFRFPDAVLFRGHPSRFHMRIERVEPLTGGWRVTTTGAEYTFDGAKGTITCCQRIGKKREVMRLRFTQPLGRLQLIHRDDDACVLQGDGFAFGVQGDSLVALATNREMEFIVTSRIIPKHFRTQGAHLLAVDDCGGFVISHDFSTKYRTAGCELTDLSEPVSESGWSFRYRVGARERVGFSVFPPRPYDWETSFEKRIVNVTGLIPDDAIRFYRKYCTVLMLFDAGKLYDKCREPKPNRGPYVFLDPEGMRRLVKTAHQLGMQVITYSNTLGELKRWYGDDTDAAFEHLVSVTREYGIDGWYFDGVFRMDNWSRAYEWLRRVRDLVGREGIIYTHCTLNPPLNRDDFYLPFIDAYSDFLLRGEGQAIDGVSDPYLRYVVNSYRISNAIPTLKWDKMRNARLHDIFRAMLGLHGRFRWAYPTVPRKEGAKVPPERAALDREFMEFYFPELNRREALWRQGKLDTEIHFPITLKRK